MSGTEPASPNRAAQDGKPLRVSIIVPCKGRLHHLQQSAAALLAQEVDAGCSWDVWIVDYGCPDGTFAWCASHPSARLHCVGVRDEVELYNNSRCRNIGARMSGADVLAFLDADKIPPKDYLRRAVCALATSGRDMVHYIVDGEPIGDGSCARYRFAPHPPELEGEPVHGRKSWSISSIVRRNVWTTVRGYDEGFEGWGYEDVDFRVRALAAGFRDWWLGGSFTFINHGDEDCTRFYRNKDKQATADQNLRRLQDRARPINRTGFGLTLDYALHGAFIRRDKRGDSQ